MAVRQDEMPLLNPDADREAEDDQVRRRLDPELRVIGSILRTLEELPADARCRVMSYLVSRYVPRE